MVEEAQDMAMTVVLRADDVPAAARCEYVHEVVSAAFGPLDVRSGDGSEPPDQVRASDLGVVRVGELSASRPGGADRRRRHIQMMDADLCKVDVVARGEVVVDQDGRQARLRPGGFAFVDLSRPAHWTNAWSTRVVAIAFPRKLLPLPADDAAQLTAVGMTGDDGTGALFSSTARQLARQVDRQGEVPADVSQRALLLRARLHRGPAGRPRAHAGDRCPRPSRLPPRPVQAVRGRAQERRRPDQGAPVGAVPP